MAKQTEVKPPKSFLGPFVLIIVLIAVAVLAVWGVTSMLGGDNELTPEKENLRATAEIALEARLNDTGANVPPLISMDVTYDANNPDLMVADFVLGGPIERQCHAPVIVDMQNENPFSIDPIPMMTIEEMRSAPAWCISTQALVIGLPQGEYVEADFETSNNSGLLLVLALAVITVITILAMVLKPWRPAKEVEPASSEK